MTGMIFYAFDYIDEVFAYNGYQLTVLIVINVLSQYEDRKKIMCHP